MVATTVSAQTIEVIDGDDPIVCNQGSTGFYFEFEGTWDDIPSNKIVVGCYAPDYTYQSPTVHYCPDASDRAASDGTEIGYAAPSESGHCLDGVYVWFEFGEWVDAGWLGWIWICAGYSDYWYLDRPSGACFAAGTPLLTGDGFKSIEQFKAGDWVLSAPANDEHSSPIPRCVKEVIPKTGQLVEITVNDQFVRSTREHPFYVKDKGWTPAASLAVGDLLRSHDDRWVAVNSIVRAGKSTVYDLCVDEHATYFVGGRDWGFSLWAYGACETRSNSPELFAKATAPQTRLSTRKPHPRTLAVPHWSMHNSLVLPGGER